MLLYSRHRELRALLCAILGVVAWSTTRASDEAPGQRSVAPEPSAPYRLSRGDELNFRFPYASELNTVATIRPDGRLALPIAGEMAVEGDTVDELATRIQRLIGAQVLRPEVVINLQRGAGQRVFVGGEVARPGVQPLVGPLTALQAVMAAEGIRDTAQPRDAIVLRRGAGGQSQVLPLNLAGLLNGAAEARDITLLPYDVVIVPRSGIADVGLWVDQYIRRILPFSLGISYTISRDGYVR